MTAVISFTYHQTVREKHGNLIVLDYPNVEVLSSMAYLFLYRRLGKHGRWDSKVITGKILRLGVPRGPDLYFSQVLATIPYDIYEREERK